MPPVSGKSSSERASTLGLQVAQSRPYLHTLGPKVGIIHINGALELGSSLMSFSCNVAEEPPAQKAGGSSAACKKLRTDTDADNIRHMGASHSEP